MSECKPKYEPLPEWSREEMEAALERADPQELSLLPLIAGLDPPDRDWTLAMCIQLSQHPDASVRGNALLGFGYLAHTYKDLPEQLIRNIIEGGLQDDEDWVRQRAEDATDDLSMWLKWTFLPTNNVSQLE
jgi:hypothetical protein